MWVSETLCRSPEEALALSIDLHESPSRRLPPLTESTSCPGLVGTPRTRLCSSVSRGDLARTGENTRHVVQSSSSRRAAVRVVTA